MWQGKNMEPQEKERQPRLLFCTLSSPYSTETTQINLLCYLLFLQLIFQVKWIFCLFVLLVVWFVGFICFGSTCYPVANLSVTLSSSYKLSLLHINAFSKGNNPQCCFLKISVGLNVMLYLKCQEQCNAFYFNFHDPLQFRALCRLRKSLNCEEIC